MPTIPPSNRAAGQTGHLTDHNNFSLDITDHETRVSTAESSVGTLQTQMATQVAQPILYAQNTAPTYNGTPRSQVWIDTT